MLELLIWRMSASRRWTGIKQWAGSKHSEHRLPCDAVEPRSPCDAVEPCSPVAVEPRSPVENEPCSPVENEPCSP
eukprot:3080227-Pleurochrysis_carterae.AAC.1